MRLRIEMVVPLPPDVDRSQWNIDRMTTVVKGLFPGSEVRAEVLPDVLPDVTIVDLSDIRRIPPADSPNPEDYGD